MGFGTPFMVCLATMQQAFNPCISIRLLLYRVDDVGGPKCAGLTPLMDAARSGHMRICRLLVEKGASMTMQDDNVCCSSI